MAENPMMAITASWVRLIGLAQKFKENEFGRDAADAMKFFDGPYDFMYKKDYATGHASAAMQQVDGGDAQLSFRMTINKVAEMVQLFGPALYHDNSFRQVNQRKVPDLDPAVFGDPEDPQVMQVMGPALQQLDKQIMADSVVSTLMQYYLNYTPNELDLKGESRQMIDETLIKGMGLLWVEVFQPQGSPIRFIRSSYDSVDNLLIDPDMESIRHAKWIARKRVMPRYEVEKRFALKKDTLRGNLESIQTQSQAETGTTAEHFRQEGETNDLVVFYEIYSRMGAGHHMKDFAGTKNSAMPEEVKVNLDRFGDYIYLAITEEYPYPLNLPKEAYEGSPTEQIFARLQWPTPFWADPADPWPFSHCLFHQRPRKVWPMSHIKPAMGELKFINWVTSFMAGKLKNTSRDFIAVWKSASEDLKTTLIEGKDLELIEIEQMGGAKTISDVVSFLQHPQFNGDIWKVLDWMIDLFERRTGLNELMFGESKRQFRSSAEAQIKGESVRIRPDDMATRVEDTMTAVARKEAIAARWHLKGEDVSPVMGPLFAQQWDKFVSTTDLHRIVNEFEYRIEAGSIRKPNRDRDVNNANQAVQVWGPVLQGYAQTTNDFAPINALLQFWTRANDMEGEDFIMQPPPPPPPPEEDPQFQLEQAKAQQEMQIKQIESQQTIQVKQAEMQLDAAEAQQKMQLDAAEAQQKARLEWAEGRQKVQAERIENQQDLIQDQQEHIQELEQSEQEHQQKMEHLASESAAKIKLAAKQSTTSSE